LPLPLSAAGVFLTLQKMTIIHDNRIYMVDYEGIGLGEDFRLERINQVYTINETSGDCIEAQCSPELISYLELAIMETESMRAIEVID